MYHLIMIVGDTGIFSENLKRYSEGKKLSNSWRELCVPRTRLIHR